jgi:hypothetical protein
MELVMTELEWLEKNRYYDGLDESKLKSIFYFSLIWNVYEKELCDKEGKIRQHSEDHSVTFAEKLNPNLLAGVFEYFKNRYVTTNGLPSEHFNTFEFQIERIKTEVYGYLSSTNPSNKDKLKALLCIAFRLRSNLFHGTKDVENLYEQNENFRQINLLLMNLIEYK